MPTRSQAALTLALSAVVALSATACQPEPDETTRPTSTAAATAGPDSTGTATPAEASPAPTDEGLALPAACEGLYSPGMLATLQQQPLNDPGVTLQSTQVVAGLEVLGAGAPSIRCTWGAAGAPGLATTVALVDAEQSAAVLEGLRQAGFACTDSAGGTLCGFEEEVLTLDDTVVTRGETHVVRQSGWIATSYVDFDPDGYTEDIVATLWG